MRKRIREYGITVGEGRPGRLNKISDVPGVLVGHATVDDERHKTGVTVILPCRENVFTNKMTAASYVHNGFGKSLGLVQLEELGTLETPIALTSTMNVGKVHDALADYMAGLNKAQGIRVLSVNPVVGECNDSVLSETADRAVEASHVRAAIAAAEADFEEGDVGAGKGTVCFGMKGGIGSASRLMELGGETYTLGVLVQTNFGRTEDFILNGEAVGRKIKEKIEPTALDRGSVMVVAATDLPVSDRQLGRILKRAGVGLSRCGSFMGHGSGDIVIGFTTANRIPFGGGEAVLGIRILKESLLETAFRAIAEATEEAVLNSLAMARTVTGYDGTVKYSLADVCLDQSAESKSAR